LRRLLGGQRTPAVPGGFHARLMAKAREAATRRGRDGLLGRLRWMPDAPAPLRATALVGVVLAAAIGVFIGRDMWRLENPPPAEQARTEGSDPVSIYRIDYFGEAPGDSLAGAYVSLLSGGDGR
jgi:hypothetical protein